MIVQHQEIVEIDPLQMVFGLLYQQFRECGVPAITAGTIAIDLVLADLWRLNTLMTLDEEVSGRLEKLDQIIEDGQNSIGTLRKISLFFWTINGVSSIMLMIWLLLS